MRVDLILECQKFFSGLLLLRCLKPGNIAFQLLDSMVKFLVQVIEFRPAYFLGIFNIQLLLSHHFHLIHEDLDRLRILPVPYQAEKKHGQRSNPTKKETCFLNPSGFPEILILGNHIDQLPVMIGEIVFDVLFFLSWTVNRFQIIRIRGRNDPAILIHQSCPAAIVGNHAIALTDFSFIQSHTEIAVFLRFFRFTKSHNTQKNRSVDHTIKSLRLSHIQTFP